MEELSKSGDLSKASMKAGMDRKTARRYRDGGQLPSQLKEPRSWRTRQDPLDEGDWDLVRGLLEAVPELEAKTLFEYLEELHPGRYAPGQLRTLQRRIRRWRGTDGPPKEVFFAQEHRPGEAMQTDFTNCDRLAITIAGEQPVDLECRCQPVGGCPGEAGRLDQTGQRPRAALDR